MVLGSDGGVYACVMWGDVVVVGSFWCTRRLAEIFAFSSFFRRFWANGRTVRVSEFFAFGLGRFSISVDQLEHLLPAFAYDPATWVSASMAPSRSSGRPRRDDRSGSWRIDRQCNVATGRDFVLPVGENPRTRVWRFAGFNRRRRRRPACADSGISRAIAVFWLDVFGTGRWRYRMGTPAGSALRPGA